MEIYCGSTNGSLQDVFFIELCWGKAMVAYTMPQQRKKEDVYCENISEHLQVQYWMMIIIMNE